MPDKKKKELEPVEKGEHKEVPVMLGKRAKSGKWGTALPQGEKKKELRGKIGGIVLVRWGEGSGYYLGDNGNRYLLDRKRIDQLLSLFKKEFLEIVGKDEKEDFAELPFAVSIRNNFRKELRGKVR